MAALRKSAQDVQKFMDAVNKKSSSQDLHKGRIRRYLNTGGGEVHRNFLDNWLCFVISEPSLLLLGSSSAAGCISQYKIDFIFFVACLSLLPMHDGFLQIPL